MVVTIRKSHQKREKRHTGIIYCAHLTIFFSNFNLHCSPIDLCLAIENSNEEQGCMGTCEHSSSACTCAMLGWDCKSKVTVTEDSLVEVGNNNFLNTIARANYFPYGIDFSRGSTGRFSNGKSLIDFIDPSTIGTRILYGVNYASASALPAFLTSQGDIMYGDHQYSLSQQVLNFENTLNQYRTMMDASALNQFLASSIAVVVTGSNDYINNYLLPGLYGSSYNYTAQQFGNLLVNKFCLCPNMFIYVAMQALHSVGLRKFFLVGIGPLEWSGEVRNISYSPDSKSVSVVYRVTLYGTDAEIPFHLVHIYGTASVDDTSYGDPVQKAEAIAFRRACARFGLGLHLYHQEDAS
ncbi:GDSL esterase/lipase [Glycine max]|nr:GDSL esterase/lipase [Glycine max]